jgi:hypothetical protein
MHKQDHGYFSHVYMMDVRPDPSPFKHNALDYLGQMKLSIKPMYCVCVCVCVCMCVFKTKNNKILKH